MRDVQSRQQTTETTAAGRPNFPPQRDFASLSVADLLEAREAHHIQLASLENVVATAIGRYLIQEYDWNATYPPDMLRPDDAPKIMTPRTLANSVVRSWSWPAVLVFVRNWKDAQELGSDAVPKMLYLPDGRIIPTCVILAAPDETALPPVAGPSQVSGLIGGGYSCLRQHQGVDHVGTVGCVVTQRGDYYALTSRHVAGIKDDEIRAFAHGDYHRVGQSTGTGVDKVLLMEIFKQWAGGATYLNLDAGLVHIDNLQEWTTQVFGIGEIGELFDATEQSVTLDLIDCPVRAFGATSGVMEGAIRALFFRYESLGGYDHATDVLIGPRKLLTGEPVRVPLTRPGDSGAIWFYDPPQNEAERARRARRLRPVAMQWGGQRFLNVDNSSSAFALGSFLSSITRQLGVEIQRDWSTGHDEYWGKLGHFAIGWKACDRLTGNLGTLMQLNQVRIGFGDDKLGKGSEFRMGRGDFVPLADVPDYVWIFGHTDEPVQHFADVDIHDINGGPSLLERCFQDKTKVSAKVWKEYFDGFAAEGVGPEEGTLPFRVWQLWEEMVKYLTAKDVIHFVAAAGVLAHYVGDASQPLHCSYLHHGRPPMVTRHGRLYPVPRDSAAFKAFKKTRAADIHSLYEEQMLEIDTPTALADVNTYLQNTVPPHRTIQSGHDAAYETIRLMHASHKRLTPTTIINADDPSKSPNERATALWNTKKVRQGTIASLGDSVLLLANLWTSAWSKGNGDAIPPIKLELFKEPDLNDIYRNEPDFVPSMSLDVMAQGQRFDP